MKEEVKTMEAHLSYETPALVEVGDFRDRTLGQGTWGWELDFTCWFYEC
ncbi:lasso RiPP family leader peptide-containing protein [Streptomyces daliensis]|uniref:Lasso RiPP family leader peptide-containing protein n=1 Tax=Streptomyces daliensis TaxID=299421 RepID=A0A8T4IWF9_9ACTN|nr:lasso RiPP family leader peptide-containing protein [Streptomyces daliensis]